MSNGPLTVFLALGVVLCAFASIFAQDALFQAHSMIVAVVLFLAMLVVIRYSDYGPSHLRTVPEQDSIYMDDVVRAGAIATVFWGVVGFLVGVVIAAQLA